MSLCRNCVQVIESNPSAMSTEALQAGAAGEIIGVRLCPFHACTEELLAALKALTSNEHLHLGDLVYSVREHEGKGWDGPAVTAWANAVELTDKILAKVEKLK